INNCLYKRYCIVHKLSYSTFLTTLNYVAIKVSTIDVDIQEIDIPSKLTIGVVDYSYAAYNILIIPIVPNYFSLNGPNRTYPSFITVLARCSLIDAKEASDLRLFKLNVA
ncbi:protein kinase domain-containing protein, partial [Colletotrichum graminicola M1.001]